MDQQELEESIRIAAITLIRMQNEDKRDRKNEEVVYLGNRITRIERCIADAGRVPDIVRIEGSALRAAFGRLFDGAAVEGEEPAEEDTKGRGRRIDTQYRCEVARHMSNIAASERESSVFLDNGPDHDAGDPMYIWEHGRDHMNMTIQRALCHFYPEAFTEEEHKARGSNYSADPTDANYSLMAKSVTAPNAENVELVDAIKQHEERMLRMIDDLAMGTNKYDQRWVALARTHIQMGCSFAVRSILQPERISLPEDDPTPTS